MDTDSSRPGSRDAQEALNSIDVARRRLSAITAPGWLYWSVGMCSAVEGLGQLLVGWERNVVQAVVLIAIFTLSFTAQRRSGMITRLTRPPARPLVVWIVFLAVVGGAVLFTNAAAHAGQGPLGYFALAVFVVIVGPRLGALWGRVR